MKKRISENVIKFISTLAVILYSISLVVYVNNTSKTYIENYFAYIVLFIFIVQFIFIYKKFYLHKIYVTFFLFIFLSLIGLFFYPNAESFDLLKSIFQIFVFSIIIYNILIYNNSSLSLEIGLVFGLLYSVYIGYFVGRDYFAGAMVQRYAGSLENPNHYAFMLTVAILFLIRRFLSFKELKINYKIINWILVSLILVFSYEVVFYALSRQGILIVLLLLTFLFYQTFKDSRLVGRMFITIISIIFIYLTFNLVINNPLLYNRLGSLFTFFGGKGEFAVDNSLYYRFRYMVDAYSLWLDKPIFGHGLHQFKYVNQSGVSHNNFLEILVNNGVVGFISYYSIYIYIFLSYFEIKKYNKIDGNWLITVLLMLFIADMTVLTYIEKPNWLIFSTVLFVINVYKKDDNFVIKI